MFSVALPTFALLKRELLVQLRMKRTFFWLLALAVITSWFLIIEWPSSDFVNWTGAARYAATVTVIVTFSAFVGSALFVPGIAAASVVVEKEQGNWDSLYLTLISPKGIVLGKFLSAVTLYMLYMFALMPMRAVVFFLVGVDWSQFISLFVFILATTGTLGVIGIACSVTCRKTVWAIVCSYIGMTVVMGLPLILVGLVVILTENRWLKNLVEDYDAVLSGLVAFVWLVDGSGGFSFSDIYWHFAYQGFLAAAAVWWTLRVVRKPAKPPVVLQGKPIDDAVALKKRQRSFPFYLIDPLRRAKPIGDHVNPMYAREMRFGLLLRRTSSVRLTYVFVLGLLLISASSALSVDDRTSNYAFEERWALCLLGHGALICAFIPAFLANLFTKENELANLGMLLMTSMTPEEIAKEKMYAAKNPLARIRSLATRSRRRTKPIVDFLNPMYAREMRHGLLFRHTHATTLGLVLISAFTGFNIDRESDFVWMWWLCSFGHGALICVFIPVFFSSLFTKESALGNLDMLLMTSLTPNQIARGKIYAAASRVGTLLFTSLAANSVMFLLFYPGLKAGFVLTVMTGQLTICVWAALVLVATMWASILSKRSGAAIITSFALSFLSLFGAITLIVILSITSRVSPDDSLIYLSPVSACGVIMEGLVRRPDDTSLAGWIVSMAMHTLAVYALYIGAIRCYASRVSTKRFHY